MNKFKLFLLHLALCKLRRALRNGKHLHRHGICGNVRELTTFDGYTFFIPWATSTWKDWPLFSGDSEYPVPSSDNPGQYYKTPWQSYNVCPKWADNTLYGRRRLLLLDYLIEKSRPRFLQVLLKRRQSKY